MTARTRFYRFLIGFGLVFLVAVVGFAIANSLIPTFGSTPEELTLVLPGDELLTHPTVNWKHAITINASPEEVWPWIAQMGDTRGAFYSFMFIERMVDSRPGLYVNADRIHPEWQDVQVGQGLIADMVKVAELEPGKYLLGSVAPDSDFGWTWMWHIAPAAEGRTRMIVHMSIQMPAGADNPAVTVFMNLGAVIMERNMMTGLKLRAEGGSEPAWIEPVEIVLWFGTLLSGLAGAWLFITRRRWQIPLAVGLGAVMALFVLTFLQPAIWLRLVMLVALVGALVWDQAPRGKKVEVGQVMRKAEAA